jgi:hypothetical protein
MSQEIHLPHRRRATGSIQTKVKMEPCILTPLLKREGQLPIQMCRLFYASISLWRFGVFIHQGLDREKTVEGKNIVK